MKTEVYFEYHPFNNLKRGNMNLSLVIVLLKFAFEHESNIVSNYNNVHFYGRGKTLYSGVQLLVRTLVLLECWGSGSVPRSGQASVGKTYNYSSTTKRSATGVRVKGPRR